MTSATASASSDLVRLLPGKTTYVESEANVTYTISARPAFRVDVEEHDDGTFAVVDQETGIFGHGEDLSAALRDFERAVLEHLDVLGRQPALSDDLAAQLSYLRERLA